MFYLDTYNVTQKLSFSLSASDTVTSDTVASDIVASDTVVITEGT